MSSTVDILIPIYLCDTSLLWTIELCLSTLNCHYPQIKVLAWDDCSPIPCPDHWPIVGASVTNLGYVATVNRLLRESTADVIIVANDDLQFTAHSLDRYFDLEDGAIAFPRDTASGNTDTFGSIFGMTRNTFGELGMLDERFRHFYSDREYAERAASKGIELRCWRDIVLPHSESSTYKLVNKEELLEADKRTFEGTA